MQPKVSQPEQVNYDQLLELTRTAAHRNLEYVADLREGNTKTWRNDILRIATDQTLPEVVAPWLEYHRLRLAGGPFESMSDDDLLAVIRTTVNQQVADHWFKTVSRRKKHAKLKGVMGWLAEEQERSGRRLAQFMAGSVQKSS
jgi:hypothetical protein